MALEDFLPATGVYRHALAKTLDDGTIITALPERLPFEDRNDTILHIANGRERLWDLAQRYYPNRTFNWDLWDVIMQFQPEPITDPSVPLPSGKEVFIPSADYIDEVFDGPTLAAFPEI